MQISLRGSRVIVSAAVLCFGLSAVKAEGESAPKKEEIDRTIPTKSRTEERGERPPQRIDMQIDAAAEPSPALKYRLYPSHASLKPGNSVPYYYRAILEISESARKQYFEIEEQLAHAPLAEYRQPENAKRIRAIIDSYQSSLENVNEATSRQQTNWDWQLNQLTGDKPFTYRLEEIQKSRDITRMLSLKARLEAAEGRFDESVRTLQQTFKLGRDVAQPSFVINALVGMSLTGVVVRDVRDTIGEAGCPNLYWALATLPDPVIPLRHALEYEAQVYEQMLPFLKDPEHGQHSSEEWARLLREGHRTLMSLSNRPQTPQGALDAVAVGLMMRGYPLAKRELIAAGMDRQKIERMPVGQVIAIHQKRSLQYVLDESLKWGYLDYRRAKPFFDRTAQRLREEGRLRGAATKEVLPLVSVFLNALRIWASAPPTLESQIKGLMALEAIRLHMAANEGRFPATLDEIDVVPVPICPLTGKAYEYRLEGESAVLLVPTNRTKSVWWELHLTRRK